MRKLIMSAVIATMVCAPGCAWFKSTVAPVATDVIDCSKAELATVTSGKSAVETAMAIGDALAQAYEAAATGGGDPLTAVLAAVESLAKTYGEDIVACVVKDMDAGTATAPKTDAGPSTAAAAPDVLAQVIEHKGWHFKGAK